MSVQLAWCANWTPGIKIHSLYHVQTSLYLEQSDCPENSRERPETGEFKDYVIARKGAGICL